MFKWFELYSRWVPLLIDNRYCELLDWFKTVFKIRQKSHLTTSCLRESHAMLIFSCFSKKCHAMKSRYGDRLMKHCFCVESCINTVLVLSFKTSKLNQAVFNQGKLKSISINLQERPRKRFYEYAILCQRY